MNLITISDVVYKKLSPIKRLLILVNYSKCKSCIYRKNINNKTWNEYHENKSCCIFPIKHFKELYPQYEELIDAISLDYSLDKCKLVDLVHQHIIKKGVINAGK